MSTRETLADCGPALESRAEVLTTAYSAKCPGCGKEYTFCYAPTYGGKNCPRCGARDEKLVRNICISVYVRAELGQ